MIAIDDGPIQNFDSAKELRRGEMGELMVTGPVISTEYVTRRDQNALHKVFDGSRVWHRMGDVGYLDDRDRFWYCGRKAHRVRTLSQTLFTEPCEAILSHHASVYRTALIGIGLPGQQRPIAIVEPWPDKRPRPGSSEETSLLSELRQIANANSMTQSIAEICIYPTRLPTDIRHNSKIFREQLVPWYEKRARN